MKKAALFLVAVCILACCGPAGAFGQEERSSLVVNSKFFTFYAYNGADLNGFLEKVHYTRFLRPEDLFQPGSTDIKGVVASTLDAILLEVSELLDVGDQEYHGTIRLVPAAEDIKQAVGEKAAGSRTVVYVESSNVMYVAYNGMTLGAFADELSQALIATYFIAPPPPTVRQALCGYVHYHIHALTGETQH